MLNDNKQAKMTKMQVLLRLLSYLWQDHKKVLVIVCLCVLVSNLALAAVSYSLKIMLDNYILPMIRTKSTDFTNFNYFLLALAALFVAGAIANYWYNKLLIVCGLKIEKSIRLDLFRKMQNLALSYFDSHQSGNIMSLYSNDIPNIQQFYTQAISTLFTNVIQVIITVSIMFSMSKILTALSLLFVIVMFLLSKYIGSWSAKHFAKRQQALADLTGLIEEQFTGLRVIKCFNHEQTSQEEFSSLNDYLNNCQIKATVAGQTIRPIIRNIGDLQFIITAIIGCLLAVNQIGQLSIGSLAAFLNFSRSFTGPFMELAQLFNTIVLALSGAERIFQVMQKEPEIDKGQVRLWELKAKNKKEQENELMAANKRQFAWQIPNADASPNLKPLCGRIEFRQLNFAYNSNKNVLSDLNLTVDAGQKIAFVGATGAGKTTISNLLNRFYEISDGAIFYDGIDIKQIKKSALRRSLGIVLQDNQLFSGTIRENILYGNLQATDLEVEEAAKLAMADSFIRRLPNGYDTKINTDMSEISEGQCQLIAIARAILAATPVLILDEATSNIDTRTERLIQMALDNLMKDKTVFIIAHRLSTVLNCDKIVVLDHGKIIEQGTHDELIKLNGIYHSLYTGQLEMD